MVRESRLERIDRHGHHVYEVTVIGDVCLIHAGTVERPEGPNTVFFIDGARARRWAEQQLAKRMKKGFVETEGVAVAPAAFDPARKRALERALAADPLDPRSWAVYADFLSSFGSPLGQRIQLELELERMQGLGKRTKQLAHERRALDQKHQPHWVGPALAKLMRTRGFDVGAKFEWRYGFITKALLRGRRAKRKIALAKTLRALLESPAARFLTSLTIERGESSEAQEFADAFELLTRAELPPTLERLKLDASRWRRKGNQSEPIELARLSALGARLPRLRSLELCLPAQGDALSRELASAPWIEHLDTLAITGSGMSDLGAEHMLAAPGHFWALGHIDLEANHLSPHAFEELASNFPGMFGAEYSSSAQYWDDGPTTRT